MAAELAFIDILRDDETIAGIVGTRISPIERPQAEIMPSIVVTRQGIEPSDTKDGVSTLDTEFIQVLIYSASLTSIITLEARIRTLLDRITPNTYNTVVIQSSQFTDGDQFSEQIENSKTLVTEHIYKVRVKR